MFTVGVFGSASGTGANEPGNKKAAHSLGYEIARNGMTIITGACNGLPHEAVKGAREQKYTALTIGISPAMNREEHVEKYQAPTDPFSALIYTGMERKGRNLISVRSCDAAIFIGGRMGTLNEFTIAYDEAPDGFIIGILADSGGLSSEFAKLVEKSGKGSRASIITLADPIKLVSRIFDELLLSRGSKSKTARR
ncbi:LOG family protein [Candidatus Azambacteria bacterium]|nr:LOG family protein [Candidatus Azambacteria bacterium]